MTDWSASIERCVVASCTTEVYAPKPGNVSPSHEFDDISLRSFVESAMAIAPVMGRAVGEPVGTTILECVKATREVVESNTNLGIILLLAPLTAVPPEQTLAQGIESALESLTVEDAVATFEAIRLAAPGGLGKADSQDVADAPTQNLRQCMILAAERDRIAAQYKNGFCNVLVDGLALLRQTADWTTHHEQRLGWIALNLMTRFGDSLVVRKCGDEVNRQIVNRATDVLAANWPFDSAGDAKYDAFDAWLRADGNQRNPGTTADLIAAILFSGLRDGLIVGKDEGQSFEFTLR